VAPGSVGRRTDAPGVFCLRLRAPPGQGNHRPRANQLKSAIAVAEKLESCRPAPDSMKLEVWQSVAGYSRLTTIRPRVRPASDKTKNAATPITPSAVQAGRGKTCMRHPSSCRPFQCCRDLSQKSCARWLSGATKKVSGAVTYDKVLSCDQIRLTASAYHRNLPSAPAGKAHLVVTNDTSSCQSRQVFGPMKSSSAPLADHSPGQARLFRLSSNSDVRLACCGLGGSHAQRAGRDGDRRCCCPRQTRLAGGVGLACSGIRTRSRDSATGYARYEIASARGQSPGTPGRAFGPSIRFFKHGQMRKTRLNLLKRRHFGNPWRACLGTVMQSGLNVGRQPS